MKKTRVLLVWLYTRADLMKPFLSLSGKIEITALFFNSREEEGPLHDGHLYGRLYWADFRTPAAILRAAKPEIIIFMGFASLKGIALRVEAAQNNIPCFMIEHGIKNDLKWISSDHKANAGNKMTFFAKNVFAKGLSLFATLFFAYSTVRWKNRHLAWIYTRMAYAFVKNPPQIALAKVKFIDRVADKYFLFGPFMIKSFLEQSDIPPERFKVIGSIFYDDFFNQYHQAATMPAAVQHKYILFIDQPVEGFIGGFTMQKKMHLFEELSAKAAVSGLRLVIKLHPNDYHNDALNEQMVRNPQITWIKAGDVPNLIYNSSACFGFFSTLLMPVICFKPCFVFDIFNIPFVKQWADMGVIFRLENEDTSGIDFENFSKYQVSEADRQHFIDTYLFKTDGKALERLEKEILK